MRRAAAFLEYKHRVVYSLLRAAVRVGFRLHLPLAQMVDLLEMAFFQEARETRGLELAAIAGLFGKSLRTVTTLNQRFRGDFFAPEHEVQLRRELAAALAARPRTEAELREAFRERSDPEIKAALEDLLRGRRILRDGDTLRRNPEDHDFFDETNLVGRIDGLNRQMDVLAETVWRRLIEPDEGAAAAARSYVFAARDEEFEALVSDVLALLQGRAIAADASAQDKGAGKRRGITIAATDLEDVP
jgi:transcriptional regulator with XRE-family HTH domain